MNTHTYYHAEIERTNGDAQLNQIIYDFDTKLMARLIELGFENPGITKITPEHLSIIATLAETEA